jgi:hypothetical protein
MDVKKARFNYLFVGVALVGNGLGFLVMFLVQIVYSPNWRIF